MYYSSIPAALPDKTVRSKKVTRRRRRTVAKDRKAIAITRVSWPSLATVPDGSLVATTTPPITLPKTANDDTKTLEKPARLHAWEHTTDLAKVVFANRALYRRGDANVLSLNISPDQIEAASRHPKGFTDYFKRRISLNLKRMQVDAPFWFGVHVKGGRLHLHGGIAANDNNRASVRLALERAGGKWAHERGKQYQCEVKPMVTPDIWANYCLSDQAKVRRIIVGKAVTITTPLRRHGKAHYLASRPFA
jgi:hypothetical protein